ncbi:hypothetical protein LJC22_01650 [Desulfosarcina sp. OttesenSCG-928-G10]|nr:hypothetical protein [Desulfosarcina sp. OttesenSCG-928-G10]MDL2321808.1 hypothetical protein [Desulfosarcina sp. OttesenSCG-928-B08]
MKMYDGTFHWDGYGGKFNLVSGRCRLRLFDLSKDNEAGTVTLLKPIIAVVSDLPADPLTHLGKMSVRSCVSHVATAIASRFKIDPQRMVVVEHYPRKTYGTESEKVIPEKFDRVELKWHGDKALFPNWRALEPPLLDTVRSLILENP